MAENKFNLTQTGQQVQSILNTSKNTGQVLAEIQEAMADLPDGQAVSAQVALNTAAIEDLSEKVGHSDGAYDISEANAVGGVLSTYADLAAALGANGANIPADLRKGGMSVKFVLTSDNKYMQYRLTSEEWSTDIIDWQCENDVYDAIFGEYGELELTITTGYYISAAGNKSAISSGRLSNIIPVSKGDEFIVVSKANSYTAVVSKTDSTGSSFTPVVIGSGDPSSAYIQEKKYVSGEDGYIIISGFGTNPRAFKLLNAGIEEQVNVINEEIFGIKGKDVELSSLSGYYISPAGNKSSYSYGYLSAPILFTKGSKVTVTAKANSNVSIISKTDAGSTSYTPVIIGTGESGVFPSQEVEYVADEDCYLVFSSITTQPICKLEVIGIEDTINKIEQEIDNHETRISILEEEEQAGTNIIVAFDNLVCIGDSLTKSLVYTSSANDVRVAYVPYPKALSRICGNQFTTLATGGFTAKDAWDTYKNDISSKDNTLGIVYLGTNGGITDTLTTDVVGDEPTNWADNNVGCYCRIVQKMKSLGYKVLLVKCWATSGSGTSSLENTNSAIAHIGERFGCAVLEDFHNTDAKYHYYPDLSGQNSVHYNDLGYAWFANKLISQVGKLETAQMKLLIPA